MQDIQMTIITRKKEVMMKNKIDDCIGLAQLVVDPTQLATVTSNAILRSINMDVSLTTLHEELVNHMQETLSGNVQKNESILCMQGKTLDLLFNNLISRAVASTNIEQMRALMELAFKAQNQSRKSILALQSLQNPQPCTLINQQNLAYNQQINTAILSDHNIPENINNLANELICEKQHEKMDIRRAVGTSRTDTTSKAVEVLNGPEDLRRKKHF